MVAQALVPRGILEDSLAVHVGPSFLEAQETASGEVNATVVEVISDRDLTHVSDILPPSC